MTDAVKLLFHQANLLNLAALVQLTQEIGLGEIGSSSIGPAYAASCDNIRQVLRERAGLYSAGERMHETWKRFGDDSGMLYFTGTKVVDGKEQPVLTAEYLTIMSDHIGDFDAAAIRGVDTVVGELLRSVTRMTKSSKK